MKRLALIILLASGGCAQRSYTLTRITPTTVGGIQTNITETLTVRSSTLLTWGVLGQFSADTKGVKVGTHEGGTETEKLNGLAESIARGVATGMKPVP